MKNKLSMIIVAIVALVGAVAVYYLYGEEPKEINKNAMKFHDEYTLVEKDNVFVYKTIDEIINILKGGTGVVYLGFPECPWCQSYVVYLNEVAKDYGIEEIYYYNILKDRNENTEKYQMIVSLLKDELLTNDEGNKRVFVPDVTFVKDGKIIAHDNETSVINDGSKPEDYWTVENINNFKNKMIENISKYKNICITCN